MGDEPFHLPEGFRFGVATAGFQVEGGYNGPGEPRNNWYGWERDGRVEPSGIAVDFWRQAERHLDRAVAAGCDGFRLSVEWARCEPADGEIDETAFDRYREILVACRDRGLTPLVTLHHFTHPWWLGTDFWLQRDSPERFAVWADTAVERLGDLVHGWVTLNEINILALMTYFSGALPPGRTLAIGALVRCLDHLLAAHVLGYQEIHAHQTDAVVATNTFTFSVYELDRLLNDVLVARLHGVDRADLHAWLTERRAEYHATVQPVAGRERVWRAWAARSLPLEQALPRAVAAVYDSPHTCTLDVTQLDYYVPTVGSHFRLPGHRTAGGRVWEPTTMLWDDPPDPEAFASYLGPNVAPGRPLWVVENGLCNRVRNGRSYPRLDGWTRPRYLRSHLRTLVRAIDAGLPIGSYFHWSLADNYEWGSYEPRFGLYGVDRERGLRWLDTDSMGDDAAGAYRRLIEGLRAGDRSVLDP
jgi:beta-glucosidase/6-phospho-beta-glucosidase/beta-galactosidase